MSEDAYGTRSGGVFHAYKADALTVGRNTDNRAVVMFDVLTENLESPVRYICYEIRTVEQVRVLGSQLLALADRIEADDAGL